MKPIEYMKSGVVTMCANGYMQLFLGDGSMIGEHGGDRLRNYNEDLTHKDHTPDLDIVRVYKIKKPWFASDLFEILKCNGKSKIEILWESKVTRSTEGTYFFNKESEELNWKQN